MRPFMLPTGKESNRGKGRRGQSSLPSTNISGFGGRRVVPLRRRLLYQTTVAATSNARLLLFELQRGIASPVQEGEDILRQKWQGKQMHTDLNQIVRRTWTEQKKEQSTREQKSDTGSWRQIQARGRTGNLLSAPSFVECVSRTFFCLSSSSISPLTSRLEGMGFHGRSGRTLPRGVRG
jgi:hypothetical protein